jgi:Domain of unknown function (DUF3806)
VKHGLTILFITTTLSMADDKKTVTIQTPSGEITFKEGSIPNQKNFNDTVSELSLEERAAIERDQKRIPGFIAAFVPDAERTGKVLEDLDTAFAAWLKSGRRDTFTAKDVTRIVGCALGSHAIRHLGVRWARVTDTNGSDIAIVAEHPLTRSFPFTSVQYRIEDNKTDFIVALFRTLEHAMTTTKK